MQHHEVTEAQAAKAVPRDPSPTQWAVGKEHPDFGGMESESAPHPHVVSILLSLCCCSFGAGEVLNSVTKMSQNI